MQSLPANVRGIIFMLLATGACSIIHVELDTTAHEIRKAPIPTGLREKLESAMSPVPASAREKQK